MKTKLVTLALAVLIFSTAHSQSFHLGVKAGANINKLSGQPFSDQFSYGYHLGGYSVIGLGSKWALQPEVLFNQSSADTSSEFSDIYTSLSLKGVSKIKLSYLSIPILLNYNASKMITLQAGPQFGILLDQNVSLVQNGKDAFKKGNFALVGGLQVNLASFKVYGRYAVGLTNLNDIDNKDKWTGQGFQIGVGFTFL
jgi:hypothetical protein